MPHYILYGESVRSDFDLTLLGLPQTNKGTASVGACLRLKKTPGIGSLSEYNDNETKIAKHYGYYFRRDVGLFEMFNGQVVKLTTVNLKASTSLDVIRILLNYPMASIFFQRGYYVLHGSAVLFEGKVFMFVGRTKAGKTTLAAYLLKHNATLITEDTAIIRFRDNKAYILPSYPLIKISQDANKYMEFSNNIGLDFPLDKNNRKGFYVHSDKFFTKPLPVDFCLFPEWIDSGSSFYEPSLEFSIGKLLEGSLSLYPFDMCRERELFKRNIMFLSCVKPYVYKREKKFSSFQSLIPDLLNLDSH